MIEIITENSPYLNKVAIVKDHLLSDLLIYHKEDKLQAIYTGIVESVQPAAENAFIRIGKQKGYLNLSSAIPYLNQVGKWPLKEGMKILVQIKRCASRNKLAKLGLDLELKERNIIYFPMEKGIVFSKKLSDQEKSWILENCREIIPKTGSILFRESAKNLEIKVLQEQIERIKKKWEMIQFKERYGIEQEAHYIPSQEEYLYSFFSEEMIKLTNENSISGIPLFDQYGLREQVEQLTDSLYQGEFGRFMIEELESFTAVDIDTAKWGKSKKMKNGLLEFNIEAAKEFARQIRLRNLQGILIVDFPNMTRNDFEKKVKRVLLESLEGDGHKTRVYGFTKLGLMEMAREGKFQRLSHVVGKRKTYFTSEYLLDKLYWFLERNKEKYYNRRGLLFLKKEYESIVSKEELKKLCKSFGLEAEISYQCETHFSLRIQ